MRKRYSIKLLFLICLTIGFNIKASAVTTYTVTSTADDGLGTLRSIVTSSVAAGDIVEFGIAGAGPHTISLATLITVNTNSITIDGFSQPGSSVNTTTITSGSALNPTYKIILDNGGASTALSLAGSNITVKGLVIKNFGDAPTGANDIGIGIGGDYNQVLGCYIGMDETGANAGSNTFRGISFSAGAAYNSIGDGTAEGVNLISGMVSGGQGIYITGGGSTNNTIKGNIIGLKADGATITGNNQITGIHLQGSVNNNTIGGTGALDGNVISGNTTQGIQLQGAVNNITIIGNIIGPRSDGSTLVTGDPQDYGIHIGNASTGSNTNRIGGNTSGERNIISANSTYGVYIQHSASTNNVIKGNYIGVASNGTSLITGANSQDYGVYLETDAPAVTIGGTASNEGNVISGNITGGVFLGNTLGANAVYGNIIGAVATGTTSIASSQDYGINISSSPDNIIGGTSSGHTNTISDNEAAGIYITGATSTGTIIKGNYIGTASDGATKINSNTQLYGISLDATSPTGITIGGTAADEGNIISGNSSYGIYLSSTSGHFIYGNHIGTYEGATASISANQSKGIYINGSADNTIGGNTSEARNIISDNSGQGIYITGAASTGNEIKGNYIGIADDGNTFISGGSGQGAGIGIAYTATKNVIGGTAANEGNVVSGNATTGIDIGDIIWTASSQTEIYGNIIGPRKDGNTFVTSSNQDYGVKLWNSADNIIGSASGTRQVISGNSILGVEIAFTGASGNAVKGNYIGIASNGTSVLSGSVVQEWGVNINSDGGYNTIGGTAANEGNLISGADDDDAGVATPTGIVFTDANSNNYVYGNIIGPQADGNTALASNAQEIGIAIDDSNGEIIGSSNGRNIISGNTTYGISISTSGGVSSGHIIKNNYIGLASNGTSSVGTQVTGIYITSNSAKKNIIGGTAVNEGNVISGNTSEGIYLTTSSTGGTNEIYGNIIGPQSDGTTYLAGQLYGIRINGTKANIIGGSTADYSNTISGNDTYGIYMTGTGSNNNLIKGNYIGPGSGGAALTGADNQDYGLFLTTGPSSNKIGGYSGAAGTNPEGNTIAFNTVDGIHIIKPTATVTRYNLISRNLIYSNTSKGININYGGSVANENKTQPVITSISGTSIGGTSTAADSVEVFKNATDNAQDAPTYLGTTVADGSGNWTLNGITLNNGETATATARTPANNNTSEFSTTIIVGLPIELLSFSASAMENSYVKLDWVTASEINNDYFTIEKTKDGINFETVATTDGAGTSSQTLYYTLNDDQPYQGTSYYRLKQTDYDGQFDYSDLTPVYFSKSESNTFDFSIFPNPSGEKENINLSVVGEKNQEVLIVIRDVFGKEYYSKTFILEEDNFAISISKDFDLAPGIYTIIASSNNSLVSSKLVVQ